MPRAAFLALLALTLPFCTTTASVLREKYEVEVAGLEGTWRVTSVEYAGRNAPLLGGNLIWRVSVVRGNRFRNVTDADSLLYQIDPCCTPPHIDVVTDKMPGAKPMTQGIYRLSRNRLTVCWGTKGSRPKAFLSKAWTLTILVELVRVK